MAGWNLTGNAVSAEFDGSDEQERKELSVSQAVEIAAGALDAIPQLSVLGEVTGFRGPNARSGHCYFQIKDDSAAVAEFREKLCSARFTELPGEDPWPYAASRGR